MRERYSDFTIEEDFMDDERILRCWDSELEETAEMHIKNRDIRLWIKNEYDWSKKKADIYYYNSDEWIINDICIEMFKERVK